MWALQAKRGRLGAFTVKRGREPRRGSSLPFRGFSRETDFDAFNCSIPARESRPFYPLPLPVRLQDASKYDIVRLNVRGEIVKEIREKEEKKGKKRKEKRRFDTIRAKRCQGRRVISDD